MFDYAKFCKIKMDDGTYQLNLTHSGDTPLMLTGKTSAWLTKYSIKLSLLSLLTGSYLLSELGTCPNFIYWIYLISTFFIIFKLPGFSVNRALREHCTWVSAYKNRKEYYKKMRKLETKKNSKNYDKIVAKQSNLTKDFLFYLTKETKRITKANKKYALLAEKSGGIILGVKGLAYEVYTGSQETVDKMIFHNKDLFLRLAPEYSDFIKERYAKHYRYAKREIEQNNYNKEEVFSRDEYIWSALNPKDNIVKNNCIRKGETSNYFERLKVTFEPKVRGKREIQSYSYDYKEASIEDLKNEVKENKTNEEQKVNYSSSFPIKDDEQKF